MCVLRAEYVRNAESNGTSIPAQLRRVKKTRQWRPPLEHTEILWSGWLHGLSSTLLAINWPMFLILADVNRLDRYVMIAEMQCRFRNVVLLGTRHVLHEDRLEETAAAILDYLHGNLLVDQGVDADHEVGSVFQKRKPIAPTR